MKKIWYWPRKMRPQYHYRSRTVSGGWRFTRIHRAHSILKFRRKVPLGVSYVGDRMSLSIRAPRRTPSFLHNLGWRGDRDSRWISKLVR